MKTLKQLADELGVSKDKVKYRTRGLPEEFIQRVDGTIYITASGVKVLREDTAGATGANGNGRASGTVKPIQHRRGEQREKEERDKCASWEHG